jgi:hypothetical protein
MYGASAHGFALLVAMELYYLISFLLINLMNQCVAADEAFTQILAKFGRLEPFPGFDKRGPEVSDWTIVAPKVFPDPLGLIRRQLTCNAGYFACSAALGGGCCPIGTTCTLVSCLSQIPITPAECVAEGNQECGNVCCISPLICDATTTCVPGSGTPTTPPVVVPPASSPSSTSCQVGYFACSAAEGGGCCPNNSTCTTTICIGPLVSCTSPGEEGCGMNCCVSPLICDTSTEQCVSSGTPPSVTLPIPSASTPRSTPQPSTSSSRAAIGTVTVVANPATTPASTTLIAVSNLRCRS